MTALSANMYNSPKAQVGGTNTPSLCDCNWTKLQWIRQVITHNIRTSQSHSAAMELQKFVSGTPGAGAGATGTETGVQASSMLALLMQSRSS
jgi:hypothetical protein